MSSITQSIDNIISNESIEYKDMMKILISTAGEVKIEVTETQLIGSELTGYTVYLINGKDSNGSWSCQQRQSEFVKVRNRLVEKWPGIFIPPLPEKHSFGKKEKKFVEKRKKSLDKFLKRCIERPFIQFTEEFKLFIRGNKINDKNYTIIDNHETLLKNQINLFYNYKIQKQKESNKQILDQIIKKLLSYKDYLSNLEENTIGNLQIINKLMKKDANIIKLIEDVNGKKNEEENDYIISFQQFNSSERKDTEISGLEVKLERLEDEKLDIDAMCEAIKSFYNLLNVHHNITVTIKDKKLELEKLKNGKIVLSTKFSFKSKTQDISNCVTIIEKGEKTIDDLTELIQVVSNVLSYQELNFFLINKTQRLAEKEKISSQQKIETMEKQIQQQLSQTNQEQKIDY